MDNLSPNKIVGHCPLCQSAYDQSVVRLLGQSGPARLFHCTCQSCGHAVLAVVVESMGAVSSVGMLTDLEASDALRFSYREPVSADECLAIHAALGKSRDLCALLLDKKAGIK